MLEILIIVGIIAFLSFLLSSPKFMRVVSWVTISGMTILFIWFSFSADPVPFYHAIVGSIIFLIGAGGAFFGATKVMDSLWPDMMIEGIFAQGKPIFVAKFWTGVWSFLVPVAVAAFIGGCAGNAYYTKVVDGYTGLASETGQKNDEHLSDDISDHQGPVSTEDELRYVTATTLNMRSGPGVSNSVVLSLSKGQKVVLLPDEKAVDGATWAHVRSGDTEGWVAAQYLSQK